MTLVWMESKINDEVRQAIEAFWSASFKSVCINRLDKEILSKEAIFLFFPEEVNSENLSDDSFDYPHLLHHISMKYEKKFEDKEKTILEVLTILKEHITSEISLEELKEILKENGFKELENNHPEDSEAAIYHLLAIISLMVNKLEKANQCFKEALRLYENNMMKENHDCLIRFYHNLSLFYKLENKIDESIEFMRIESLFLGPKENKTKKELEHLFQIELQIAKYYLKKEDFKNLDDIIQTSLLSGKKVRTDEELVEIYEVFLKFYHKKARFFHKQGDFEKALDYYLSERKMIDIIPFEEEEQMRRLAHLSSMLAEIFVIKKDYEKAEYYYLDSIELREKLVSISKAEYRLLLEYSYECLMSFYRRIEEKEKFEKIKAKYEAFKGGNK